MKYLSREEGAALIVVLAVVVLSTALFAVVLYFIQRGTETSGLEKKYETARDASLGALDVFAKEIIPLGISAAKASSSTSLTNTLGNFASVPSATISGGATNPCFSDKMLKSTANWDAACSSTANPKVSPDITFTLRGTNGQPFNVYTKIVDTMSGNSNTSGMTLEGAGVAESSIGIVSVEHFPYMYSIDVQGERQTSPNERAMYEALYAY
jgi:hypothetical protein